MAGYTEFKIYLEQNDAFKAFQVMCEMIEMDNVEAVQADKDWGKYIHSQNFNDYKHILSLSEGYFNQKYTPEQMGIMYNKFDQLFEFTKSESKN